MSASVPLVVESRQGISIPFCTLCIGFLGIESPRGGTVGETKGGPGNIGLLFSKITTLFLNVILSL